MTPTLIVDNGKEVTAKALTWPEKAHALRVVDAETYDRAGELLKGIKALRDEIADTFDPHIKRAHEAHRALCREKQDAEAPLAEAERILKSGLSAYAQEQERIRREEERRLQEEARKREEQRRLEEAAALEREAKATGDQALEQEAHALLARPVMTPPVTVASSTPKVAGITHRDAWSAKVTSLVALIKFVAAHPEHQNLLQPNQAALNQLARAMKANLKIDGVQAVNTPTVAARA